MSEPFLKDGDQLVGERRFGHATVGEADHVVELLRLAAVDLQADAGRHQAAGRNRDLEHLAVDLALELDQADAGDQLAGLRGHDVLHVADVDLFLLGAGLEPALRGLLLLLARRPAQSRRQNSPTTPAAMTERREALMFRLVIVRYSFLKFAGVRSQAACPATCCRNKATA